MSHYWSVIRSCSQKSTGLYTAGDVDKEKLLQDAKPLRKKYCFGSDCSVTRAQHLLSNDQQCDIQLESQNLESMQHRVTINYAAGIPLKDVHFRLSPNCSPSSLGTVLDLYPTEAEGISYPFLYVGQEYATFPWHTEDGALFSFNILHFGAPTIW